MNQIVLLAKEGKVRALEPDNKYRIDELMQDGWQVKKQIVAIDWIEKICNGSEFDLQQEFLSIMGNTLPKPERPLNIYTLGITSASKLKWAFMVVREGEVIYTNSGDVADRHRNYGSLGGHVTAAINGILWAMDKEKQCHLYVQDFRLVSLVSDLFTKGAHARRPTNPVQKWYRESILDSLKSVRSIKIMKQPEYRWKTHLRNMFKKNSVIWKNAV